MLRLLMLTVPLLAVAGIVPAAPVPKDGGKQFYFPTKVGTKWIYKETVGEGYGEIITKSVEKDGRWFVTVKATSIDFKDDESTTIFRYAVSDDGVFRIADGLESKETRMEYGEPFCLLKLPHKVGEKWQGDSKDKGPVFQAGKVETVKVPAGTFEAIRVDSGEDYSRWYAPGVGAIKKRNKNTFAEMKSFALPKE